MIKHIILLSVIFVSATFLFFYLNDKPSNQLALGGIEAGTVSKENVDALERRSYSFRTNIFARKEVKYQLVLVQYNSQKIIKEAILNKNQDNDLSFYTILDQDSKEFFLTFNSISSNVKNFLYQESNIEKLDLGISGYLGRIPSDRPIFCIWFYKDKNYTPPVNVYNNVINTINGCEYFYIKSVILQGKGKISALILKVSEE